MIVLWAMSVWAAVMVLLWTGFGDVECRRRHVSPRLVVGVGGVVWLTGWWTWHHAGMWLNIGFVLLTAASWAGLLVWGQPRWWMLTPILAILATLTRLLAPFAPEQASVMPTAAIESLGLGTAAGIGVARPLPASLAACAAEGLSAVIVALEGGTLHHMGRTDLAVAMLAGVAAWTIAWLVSGVSARFSRPA